MSRSFSLALAGVFLAAPGCAGRSRGTTPPASPVRVQFVAQADSFSSAAREYERLWATEGARIVQAMQRVSGLTFISPLFADTAIVAQVLERASSSGYRTSPMQMRASYPFDTKRATLIHELGHRLQAGLFRRDEEEHGPLFLWIYDVWVDLYGREFADAQVMVERRRGGPYPAAWDAAMALSRAERAAEWKARRDERMPTRR